MSIPPRAAALAAALSFVVVGFGFSAAPTRAQGTPPITLHVDASRAVQGLLAMHETIPVSPGALTLMYPRWIPGEHSPSGPIPNLAGIQIHAGTQTLAWTRDPVDLYAFHLDVPSGTTSLSVDFLYLAANSGNYSSARTSTPNLLSLTWNKVILTPKVEDYADQTIAPSITLPGALWKYATALETVSHVGADVTFKPVTQEMLIDSPLDAGINARTWHLGTFNGAPVDLAAFADTPQQLDASDKTIAKFRKLVAQMHGVYRYRHFNHYTFLLTVSDVMPGEGVEHHQSSDDGSGGGFLTDEAQLVSDGDLLCHEWNHSWDGKYRRPYDLAKRNLQDPEIDDLLWVYEGMTQFYGELQAERSGLWTKQQWLDNLAGTYAFLDTTPGRDWRPLLDTATAASVLYSAPDQWESERRSVDYYPEGALMWLEADVMIRRMSGGHKSLDDVARRFFGNGHDTGPQVVTYDRADLVRAMNAVQPYDWAGFFHRNVDEITAHPPDPITTGGYKLVYTDTPSGMEKIQATVRKGIDARYSLGLMLRTDGTVVDVVPGSPAYQAGIGPGDKIVALDDRALTDGASQLDDALKAHRSGPPLRVLISGGETFRTVAVPYTGGPRYPHLERLPGTPDELSAIAASYPAVAR
ncbi:MAG TPA: PDZ domain-containing protein [Candidatus Sulfotelmatobacter sp.]|nr:PDZ domain-containing protein [Candidatus Sulfotelmatobacter sp.]